MILSWVILSTNSCGGTDCEKRKIKMYLGMFFNFHLFHQASWLARPLNCFFPTCDAKFGIHCCFSKSWQRWKWTRASVEQKLASTQTSGTEKVCSDRDYLSSSNGKE